MSAGSRILFVSFHFRPSLLVGARRPSATADHLSRCGYRLTVVRGVAPDFQPELNPLDIPIKYVNIKVRPKRRSRVVYLAKAFPHAIRMFMKSRGNLHNNPDSSEIMKGPVENGSSKSDKGPLKFLVEILRGIDGSIQYRKFWLFVALLKVFPLMIFRRTDLVVASGPPMASFICGWLAAVVSRRPLILDYRDPWFLYGEPEHAELDSSNSHGLTGRFENWMAKKCALRCSAIITASEGICSHLVASIGMSREKIYVVPNGFDKEALVAVKPPLGSLEILYAGSLYWNRDPFPFFEALVQFLEHPDVDRDLVRLRMVGHCKHWNGVELLPWLTARGLNDVVTISEFVKPEEIRQLTEKSNLLLNFAQGQSRQIPAKSFEYIAARRYTLVIAEENSDVARLFNELDLGRVVSPANMKIVEEMLLEVYLDVTEVGNKKKYLGYSDIERFSRTAQVDSFSKIVDQVLHRVD